MPDEAMPVSWPQRLAQRLQRSWWTAEPDALARGLRPLARLYGVLWCRHRRRTVPRRAPVPVVVVGNLIVGGAGKTPTVVTLVNALRSHGWHPGVVSRGYGRRDAAPHEVRSDTPTAQVGDEPLLIHRDTGAPVVVARDRLRGIEVLCQAHPGIDVVVSDDGLQHLSLARDVEVVVFDRRGAGNGLLLPAGPLREPFTPAVPRPGALVLYTDGVASTPWPGFVAQRRAGAAVPLAAWLQGSRHGAQPLAALRGRRWLAVAGIANPTAFFEMLRDAGLDITTLPLPDHHGYAALPWPAGTEAVLTTAKDAVKLRGRDLGATRVEVVGLDFALPDAFVHAVLAQLGTPRPR